MMIQKSIGLIFGLLLIVGSSGCCCVDTCCTSSCNFGGAGCNQLCGMECGGGGCGGGMALGGGCGAGCDSCTSDPCDDCGPACGTMVGNFSSRQLCGDECGCDSCTSCTGGCGGALGSGCFGWNVPQFFVDGNGRPCLGPIYNLAQALRGAAMNCGCGGLYVDEWISDPPLCSDPCDSRFSGGDSCGCACSDKIDAVMAKRKYNWGGRSRSACSDCQSQTASSSSYRQASPGYSSQAKKTYSSDSRVAQASYKKQQPTKRSTKSTKTAKKKMPTRTAGWFN